MSTLCVYRNDADPSRREEYTDPRDIARVAAEAGIRFERWAVPASLGPGATQDEILAAYRDAVERLQRENGFATADVIAISTATQGHPAIRRKFLAEHIHAEDEARFFVDGAGLFYIHHGSAVFGLRCERGDLINVPAGTRHWFDMGPAPRVQCIRLFTNPSGWVAEFTGSDIATRFPMMEADAASEAAEPR
jgi:1,2-dihydroxy-3-keto-5-methylthiopentene dioxygenase